MISATRQHLPPRHGCNGVVIDSYLNSVFFSLYNVIKRELFAISRQTIVTIKWHNFCHDAVLASKASECKKWWVRYEDPNELKRTQ